MKKCIDCKYWIAKDGKRGCLNKLEEISDFQCIVKITHLLLFSIYRIWLETSQRGGNYIKKAEKMMDKVEDEMGKGDEWRKENEH